jgi:hypothetical protein
MTKTALGIRLRRVTIDTITMTVIISEFVEL